MTDCMPVQKQVGWLWPTSQPMVAIVPATVKRFMPSRRRKCCRMREAPSPHHYIQSRIATGDKEVLLRSVLGGAAASSGRQRPLIERYA